MTQPQLLGRQWSGISGDLEQPGDDLGMGTPRKNRRDSASEGAVCSDYEVDLRMGDWEMRMEEDASPHEKRTASGVRSLDSGRQILMSWRLRRGYVIYCLLCLVLSGFLFLYTMMQGHALEWQFDLYRHQLWEEIVELVLGVSIVTETVFTYRVVGFDAFFRNKWCVFDMVLSVLTVLSWLFIVTKSNAWIEHLEGYLEMPLLAIRFALQPLRVISTFMALHKARKIQKQQKRIEFEAIPSLEEVSMRGLTEFESEISMLHPCIPLSVRYNQWHLGYKPSQHGLSLQTMYRRLSGAGPVLILLRDDRDDVYGALAARIRKGSTKHFSGYGRKSTEETCYFVFDRYLQVHYYASEDADACPAFYCDDDMFCFGSALVVKGDFLRGSSSPCSGYHTSRPLGKSTDFVIKSIEVWVFAPLPEEVTLDKVVTV